MEAIKQIIQTEVEQLRSELVERPIDSSLQWSFVAANAATNRILDAIGPHVDTGHTHRSKILGSDSATGRSK